MKWYIEFPIVWIVAFLVIFALTPYRTEEPVLGLIIALIFGTIVSVAIYGGYRSTKKKDDSDN